MNLKGKKKGNLKKKKSKMDTAGAENILSQAPLLIVFSNNLN